MRKEYRYHKKRSLKTRIEKMISTINFSSLFIMMVAFIILFGMMVSLLGNMVSENIAKQMRGDFEVIWKNAIESRRITNNIEALTPDEMWIFRAIGERYKLFDRNHELLDSMKQTGLNVLSDEDKKNMNKILLFEYEVFKGEERIYTSANRMGDIPIEELEFNKFVSIVNKDVQEIIRLDPGNVELTLKVRLNPLLIVAGYFAIVVVGIVIFFITHCIAGLFTRAFSGVLIQPLNDLDNRLNQVVEGNIEAAICTEIILKKPVREVESLANSTNKIIAKMSEYINLMECHREELEAQNIELEENSSALTSMNASLASKHSKLKNILNHVEQGFLTFNVELLIDDEYSLECERIFGKDIVQSRLSSLLYPEDTNMQKFMDELILKVFNTSKANRNLYLSLLPEEVLINGQNISLTYKIVINSSENEVFMVILNDITEKRKLEKRMDQERSILKMVVKSITNRNEFIQLMNEFKTFVNEEYKGATRCNVKSIA